MIKRETNGFSLLEMVIYIAILSLVLVAIINVLISISRLNNHITVAKRVSDSAITSLERMGRDIRNTSYVVEGSSVLDTHPGQLTIETPSSGGGATTTTTFSLSNAMLRVTENDVDEGPLTASSTQVTSLIFRLINTVKSRAVRVEMTLVDSGGNYQIQETFYLTVGIRGAY